MSIPKGKLRRAAIVAVPALIKVFNKRDSKSISSLKLLYSALVDAIIIKSKGTIKDNRNRYREYQSFSYLICSQNRKESPGKNPKILV